MFNNGDKFLGMMELMTINQFEKNLTPKVVLNDEDSFTIRNVITGIQNNKGKYHGVYKTIN